VLSFVRISRLNWIGHVNRKDNKRKISQVLNNPLGKSPERMTKTDDGTVYKRILMDAKLKTGKRGRKTGLGQVH
jgi:streptogramin lyase